MNDSIENAEHLISPEQLARIIDSNNLVVLDGSWYLPNQHRNARDEFDAEHIPGAQFFDIDDISDPSSSLPHTIPSTELFAREVENLGVSNHSELVVYDGAGLFSAARVWWMFKLYGHDNIRILDGGLPAWKEAGYPLTGEHQPAVKGSFNAAFHSRMLATEADIQANCVNGSALVLDARSAGRFSGADPEPRIELSSGHMPGALSLPFTELLHEGSLKQPAELKQIFQRINEYFDKPVITSCGSGVTAAILNLAMAVGGYGMHRLYDGSWTEWASNPDNPIVKD